VPLHLSDEIAGVLAKLAVEKSEGRRQPLAAFDAQFGRFIAFIKESLERIETQGIDRDKEQRIRHERLEEQVDGCLKEQREESKRFADPVDGRFSEQAKQTYLRCSGQKVEQTRLAAKMDAGFEEEMSESVWRAGGT